MIGVASPHKDHVRGTGQSQFVSPAHRSEAPYFLYAQEVLVTTGLYRWQRVTLGSRGLNHELQGTPAANGMSLSSKFTNSSNEQVMESYYSCNQGYAPWNPTPYQPHDLGYATYQSYGFGDAYYGYEDPSPPYPPPQKGIEELIQLLCQERKEIRKSKNKSPIK
ncbi:hypothetical protein PIB30_062007 [Stylosanthes scabra]|uniref:Uncharacterized protein n=1 Tax=Stylosanthes scabra TaxID=79078 RepID=A0ABU6QLK9_9FABA|nr:hypothetical protein [Stylosanthes scabra]